VARTTATTTAMTVATSTTWTTESWNIASLDAVLTPCFAIRAAKVCDPTTITPAATITMARRRRRASPRRRCAARPRQATAASQFRHWRRGAVPDAAHRRDIARMIGIVAKLLAQSPHVRVDRAVHDPHLSTSVDGVEQLVAR